MKKYGYYLLPGSLLLGIIITGYMKVRHGRDLWRGFALNGDIIFVALYLLWTVYEIAVSRRDVVQEKVVSDYGTREFYGASHALTILSALWCDPRWPGPGPWHLVGFILFIAGVAFRVWAIRTLGSYYSHTVRRIQGHRVIDSGPYGVLRHPAYTGMIAAHGGVTLFFFNYWTLGIFLLLLIPAIVTRIIIEEKTLFTIQGYREFAAGRKRIVPFIW